MACKICSRTQESVGIHIAQFYDPYDVIVLDTFMCKHCKEAFEWGTAYPEDDVAGHYVEFGLYKGAT